ncbi:MAG: glutamine--fructose-6-phosphate transaminase (isomerizing) [Bacteroidia bacterium]|nr:glutamine--fructose-6-phosphate transaminase (isomerizing) [Bacteroidia bacterium]MDW8301927.1 glutamine--fructose-6-phosphate transaminase (isomerizing) [Bacteroidia bacterium]
MCGIVAYIGNKQAYPIVIKGLKRLEYRGYDSAGIAILNGRMQIYKRKGKVSELEAYIEELLKGKIVEGTIGMGHTRWATHGEPNDINAHPHTSQRKDFAIIHNGIIENYETLKQQLIKLGHHFESETDTEVLAHLIEEYMYQNNLTLDEAVRMALNNVVGAYGIVVMSEKYPDMLIGARKGSPLVLGIGEKEYMLASDATPIVEITRRVVYLNDGEMVIAKRDGFTLKTIDNVVKTPFVQYLELELEELEKGGYEHFMLKEIFEQPTSISNCIRGRINPNSDYIHLGGIAQYIDQIAQAQRIIIVGCGTSWHAGLVGEYIIEDLTRIPVEVEYASEFRYRNPIIHPNDVVIAISQSGETADTLAAIQLAKSKGALILGICNVVGSSIPRITDAGIYTHAGPEIGVASTKAFTAQVTALIQLALKIAQKRGINRERVISLLKGLTQIPQHIQTILRQNEKIKEIAAIFKDATNFLYLGRGYNFPVALEGALKLKEISYIHAEGYPAAEMKHGPIALIDENMPVVFIATKDSSYEKIINNIMEVKARKGRVIAIVTEHDVQASKLAEFTIQIPEVDELLTPILSVIPLQLLSYHIAVMRGCNVDQPRNLAKSVTVE